MFKKLQNKSNQLYVYYLLELLIAIGGTLTHATYYIYLTSELGLSNSKAMFLDTVLFIGIFFLEVPTGIFGDIFGTKFSFIIGRITLGLSLLIYFASPKYNILIVGSVLYAFGMAFESGAFESWIVGQVGKKDRNKIFTLRDIIRKISVIVTPVMSIYIAEKTSYGFPYFVSFIFAMITSAIGIIFMREQKEIVYNDIKEMRGLELLLHTGKESINSVSQNTLLRSFVISILLSSFGFIAVNSYTSKLIEISLNSGYIGFIVSASSLVSILFSLLIVNLKLLRKLFIPMGVLGAFVLLMIGMTNSSILLIILIILEAVFLSVFEIGKQTELNNLIEKNRVTTLSVFSLIGSIGSVLGTLIFGILADRLNIQVTFSIAGVAILLGVLMVSKINS